jgi:hypothetical protein
MPKRVKDTPTLDDFGMLEATSKSSLRMDYLRHYEEMLSPYRHKKINLIEIGVQNGASLRMWEKYFSKAVIVGIDINEKAKKHETDRSTVEIGSQADRQFLTRVAKSHPPTVVVDDGSHRADYTILSLETLFPMLEPGGCYIIEDLFLHFGSAAEQWRGEATITPVTYLERLLPGILSKPVTGLPKPDDEIVDLIDRYCVIPGAIFIWKVRSKADLIKTIAHAKDVVARTNIAVNWVYLTIFIMKNGGPGEEAEFAARTAVSLEPSTRSYRVLSQALQFRGQLDGAIEAMELALAAAKQPHEKAVVSNGLASLVARRERMVGQSA